MEDRTYTFAEIAAEVGITENELVEFAIREGLLNVDGTPTQKAIDEGLLTTEYSIGGICMN